MWKIACDECGKRFATLSVIGGNPIPTNNLLSHAYGNQGYSLCDECRKIDPKDWKNIQFNPDYLEGMRRSVGFVPA